MPSVASLVCRLIWIGSLVLALVSLYENSVRYRCWCWYLFACLFISPLFWPELPGWTDDFWPALFAIAILRLIASIESFHHRTRDFRWWWLLAAAVFMTAFWLVLLVDFAAGRMPH